MWTFYVVNNGFADVATYSYMISTNFVWVWVVCLTLGVSLQKSQG